MSTKQSAKPAEQVNADVPQSESPKKSAPLALPAPPAEKDARILDVNEGNVIKLDELGPMVINSDGTVSRISNWKEMSKMEQDRTVRLLVKKRNQERIQKLQAGEADSEGAATPDVVGEE